VEGLIREIIFQLPQYVITIHQRCRWTDRQHVL